MPRKLVPVSVTTVPVGPLVGVKLVMLGGLPTKNGVAELTVPADVATVIRPELLPEPTLAVRLVAETTVTLVATVPLKRTAVAPVKPVPVSVTTVPTGPRAGVKLVMVGPGTNVDVGLGLGYTTINSSISVKHYTLM